METAVLLTGYLAPPAGFRALAAALPGYHSLEPPRLAHPARAFELWRSTVPEAAHLVAFAEAAWSAAQLAAEKKAKSLVLFSPIVRADPALEARLRPLQTALRGGLETFAEAAKPWLFGPFLLEHGQEVMAAWAEGLADLDLAVWLEALLALPDGRKHLRQLLCPVLVVLGAEDVFAGLRYGQEVVEWTPVNQNGLGAVRVSLEGCGHLVPWENPEEAVSLVGGFLKQAEGVAGEAPVWGDG